MQKIQILVIGKIKESWIKKGCEDFVERLNHLCKIDVTELPASKENNIDRQRSDESARMIDAAKKFRGAVIVLDETGERMTSQAFASMLGKKRDAGEAIAFCIGGAYGFTDEVRKIGVTLRLSDMTFTHEMSRVILLEQLYRAMQIGRGSGYHH